MDRAIYTPNTAAIPRFLAHIQSAGTPSKVTQSYLKSVGFKSGNDSYLIPIMKALGFVDVSGVPTDRWKDYRNKSRAQRVLGSAMHATYVELFETYPDADQRPNEALRNFFSTHHSKLSESTLELVVRTFKTLAAHAAFDTGADGLPVAHDAQEEGTPSNVTPPQILASPRASTGPDVHIDVQIHIPATATAEQIDQIFASMGKHLYAHR